MMRQLIQKAMIAHDDYVIELQYRDRKNRMTTRVVSPIRFVGKDRFMALCLCREEPRIFCMKYCENVQLKPAWDYLMPVPMVDVVMVDVAKKAATPAMV